MTHRERFQTDLLAWASNHTRSFPWRNPDRSLYEVFVAEFFLTQTPADNVASVYPEFINWFPSLTAIQETTEAELADVIRPLGFHNMRASALKQIAADHDTLPETPSFLQELPRVGEYVANATICFTYDEPLPILDRNVERIYSRVFGDDWPDTHRDQVDFAAELVPDDTRSYNLALLDLGATVCRPDPRCHACFATGYCRYYQNDRSPDSA